VGWLPQCDGEYDRYARTVARLLAEGADEVKLADYLRQVQTNGMGLSGVDADRDRSTARRLRGLVE
jgi:hypothetical protein